MRYSERSAIAGRVRAAARAGSRPMRLTIRRAAAMTTSGWKNGIHAVVDTPRLSARSRHAKRPRMIPIGTPDDDADRGQRCRLPRDRGAYLATGEAKRLHERELALSAAH